jgi:hypothetical protein
VHSTFTRPGTIITSRDAGRPVGRSFSNVNGNDGDDDDGVGDDNE